MKRAILLLVTAFLGTTSCYSRRCIDDIVIFWHFQSPSNGAELTCAQAGVNAVQVTADGAVAGTFACSSLSSDGVTFVQGITLLNFDESNHSFQLDGLDANNNVIYSSGSFTFRPTGCTENQFDTTLTAVSGDLTIDFHFPDIGFACTNTNTFMWYELLDGNNQVADIVGPNNTPQALPCTNGAIPLNQLPFGPYTVSRIQEVEFVSGGGFVTHHATCDDQSFQHLTAGETVTVQVPASTGNCF